MWSPTCPLDLKEPARRVRSRPLTSGVGADLHPIPAHRHRAPPRCSGAAAVDQKQPAVGIGARPQAPREQPVHLRPRKHHLDREPRVRRRVQHPLDPATDHLPIDQAKPLANPPCPRCHSSHASTATTIQLLKRRQPARSTSDRNSTSAAHTRERIPARNALSDRSVQGWRCDRSTRLGDGTRRGVATRSGLADRRRS